MPKDALIASAIAHWAPRFVSNGISLAEFEEVTASLERREDWCKAWCAKGEGHEKLGRDALAQGYRLTAGEHLTRAAMYYHFAKFVFVQFPQEMRAAHMRAVGCYRDALPYLRPAGERVRIPYQGQDLWGVLRKPEGVVKPPVLVMAPGMDSTKEELHAYQEPFLARGMAIVAFDGPGQGEAEYELPIRGDYEVPVRAVIDWVESRADLDTSRIGMWGVSLGGYYAPRATAFEPRLKACIGISGPFDLAECWEGLGPLTKETFRVRSHAKTEADAKKNAATLTLKDAAKNIRCPLYIVAGRQDRLIPPEHAERLAKAASGPVELLMVEDGGHNANNRPYRYRSQSADWMAERLGVPKR
jgi:2,6-dihydroxypseudooxynicotine hydrolase